MQQRIWHRLVGILLMILGLLGVSVVVAAPATASAPVLLSGSSWLGGKGVNVCAPSTDPYCGSDLHVGGPSFNWWQCVELAQRLYQKHGWHGGIFAGVSYAYQIYDQAGNLGMSRQANDSISSIVPGDMIVHGSDTPYSGGAGHVSIVDYKDGSTIHVVEQNTYNNQPRATYTLSGGTLSRPGTGTIRGVVHDPNNQPPAPPAPVPSPWYGVENGIFDGDDRVGQGQTLQSNHYIMSKDGRFVLHMQAGGNLVLANANRGVMWVSGTGGNAGSRLVLQHDGNMVIYRPNGTAIWSTGQKGIVSLVLQSDGNAVGVNSSGGVPWATGTGGSSSGFNPKETGDTLPDSWSLVQGQYLRSADGRYTAVMQFDGNFVVYAPGYRVIWNSGTPNNAGSHLVVQHDGNVVIYRPDDTHTWSTGKIGISSLTLQSDGNLVGHAANGDPVWATNTSGKL